MKTAIILGADRVGKTTLVNNTINHIVSTKCLTYIALHFSGVLPTHNSPVQQFLDPLRSFIPFHTGLLICDRFSPETLFYEKYRRQTGKYDKEFSHIAESAYMSISDSLNVILLCPQWSDAIEDRHREELIKDNPQATKWWVERMVNNRKKEHEDYYSFMYDYLYEDSLFDESQIYAEGHLNKSDSIFTILPEYLPQQPVKDN